MPELVAPEIAARIAKRESSVFMAREAARRLERELLVSPASRNINAAFRHICFVLIRLAQKYIPAGTSNFADYSEFLYCIKLLKKMGLKPEIPPRLAATIENLSLDVIESSFAYRQLRNKIKASLSVIADLTDRPADAGSQEYQQGMREGFRRASDIAIMFLDDLEEPVES